MNIPLINTNDKESINTSLIAIKRATEELNNLIKIADEKMAQLDEKAKKYTDDKINALDVASVGGSGKYISAISETDGKISATASDITSSVSSGNSQPVTSGGVASAIAPLQPIDSVTSGNLQPVTSNAVSRAMSYSTEEVFTGKYWSDGKKIYSKSFMFRTSFPTIQIQNIENITKVEGYVISNLLNRIPIPWNYPSGNEIVRLYLNSNAVPTWITSSITLNTTKYSVVALEYTKTTD